MTTTMTQVAKRPIGEERPRPKVLEELGILVLDGSGSMKEEEVPGTGISKAERVMQHQIRDPDSLVERLKGSRNSDRISIALVTFDSGVRALDPQRLDELDTGDLDVPLVSRHGGSTAIGRALAKADEMAQTWMAQADVNVPRYVTILLMSDGGENCGSQPLETAASIKQRVAGDHQRDPIVIAAAAYGDSADTALLENIASMRPDGTRFFAKVDTGADLRDFFLQSMSAT
jgi:uncharacterized protein YegL